jgi:hypothetical protein
MQLAFLEKTPQLIRRQVFRIDLFEDVVAERLFAIRIP